MADAAKLQKLRQDKADSCVICGDCLCGRPGVPCGDYEITITALCGRGQKFV